MSDFLVAMGRRIMIRRKELGLSQEQVAELVGLTPQTISTAERGEKALRPENIVKLCAALEVTPNYVLLGEAALTTAETIPSRLAMLTPMQIKHLEIIIDNYIAAVSLANTEKTL